MTATAEPSLCILKFYQSIMGDDDEIFEARPIVTAIKRPRASCKRSKPKIVSNNKNAHIISDELLDAGIAGEDEPIEATAFKCLSTTSIVSSTADSGSASGDSILDLDAIVDWDKARGAASPASDKAGRDKKAERLRASEV